MKRFFIRTFGCQMNVHDSDRVHEMLLDAGMHAVQSPDEADLVVINTCSVREKAELKLDSELGKLRKLKEFREQPLVIVVAGCVARQRGEAMLRRLPFVDVVIGPDNLLSLVELVEAAAKGAPPIVATDWDLHTPVFLQNHPREQDDSPSAFVSISKGCDERCSFCIVPSTRGPERHRSSTDIIKEIRGLVRAGVKQVILLGQTVNNYQDPSQRLGSRPSHAKSDFAALLRRIAADAPELRRLRYTSPHPRYFDDALIEAHGELDVLCRHVHMPVQSGSDRILKRMIRRHDRSEYLEAVRKLKAAKADLTVSTDLIVGFPTESEEDFHETLSLMREASFVGVYGFKYSPRPGTAALRLGDDVVEEVKSERLTQVFDLSEKLMGEHLDGLVGSIQQVLIEEPNPRGQGVSGHTDRNEIVHAQEPSLRVGDGIVAVRILRAYKHSLVGELVREEPGDRERFGRRLPVLTD